MDPIANPFSPGAGAPPPELVGRDPLLQQTRVLFARIRQKRPEKSLLLTGLRGVGKTVLLNEMERMVLPPKCWVPGCGDKLLRSRCILRRAVWGSFVRGMRGRGRGFPYSIGPAAAHGFIRLIASLPIYTWKTV